ncbi:UPF0029-domain-containing protein [Daedalea quercina L-15889]|uniref:UPF0029-domain-containing protein n=1 Tax=Daedalea quercina L-15889 TaxID=1314783 RepID=A0A165S518_9APHY|nr:UPF0029-domain-containing protein [Daedalea quercina L-15889]
MSRAPSPHFPTLDALIEHLSADPDREELAAELGALQSIYGDDAVRPWENGPSEKTSEDGDAQERRTVNSGGERGTIRYEVAVTVSPPSDSSVAHPLTLLVSLPPSYPASTPPQLQLLSRYIGPYGVDASLFGAVLRTYISRDGVDWAPGGVCVFDGVEWVREACVRWLGERMSERRAGEMLREDERAAEGRGETSQEVEKVDAGEGQRRVEQSEAEARLPEGVEFVVAEPIVDRKSVFIGRACRITHPSQVPMILSHLMSDRRIARAAHPVINAWRCRAGNNLHQDNDDDGETAAGGRLAHLLQILDVENVLVVVTRYFGGIHLGPDRFKHINQAARNALEQGGFLDVSATDSHTGRKKGRGAHK